MKRMSRGMLSWCLAVSCSAAWGGGDNLPAVLDSLQAGRPHVANELLLQFRADADAGERQALLQRYGAQALERLAARRGNRGELQRVRLPQGLGAALLERLSLEPALEFAEPNWLYSPQSPNDPYLSALWGMQGATTATSEPYGSGALAAWSGGQNCAAQVVLGVIDEGVMIAHPDLSANIWVNPAEQAGKPGVDDDGNGYVDDLHGWDFNGKDASVYDGNSDDHGSHVAGTLAASINNGIGVFGVCPQARLVVAKFLGPRGGTTANAVKAVNYLTDLKSRHGLRLVASNNSWGGGGYSQALANAIAAAGAAQILFVAAAGNDAKNIDAAPSYPASYALDNVLAVAALTRSGGKASFSNWGEQTVAIAAPGVDILSTVPSRKGAASYAYYSGTSMATPHVTGAAALYASLNPCASAAQIKAALLAQAGYAPGLAGYVQQGRYLDVAGFGAELACP